MNSSHACLRRCINATCNLRKTVTGLHYKSYRLIYEATRQIAEDKPIANNYRPRKKNQGAINFYMQTVIYNEKSSWPLEHTEETSNWSSELKFFP